jgi:hypothetical protein
MSLELTPEQLDAIRRLAGYDKALWAYVRDQVLEEAAKNIERGIDPDATDSLQGEVNAAIQAAVEAIRAMKGPKP